MDIGGVDLDRRKEKADSKIINCANKRALRIFCQGVLVLAWCVFEDTAVVREDTGENFASKGNRERDSIPHIACK
jgi:uncharacterized protein YaiI (UPF0178 family)